MSENNGTGSRWWEFNLVKYFLGTLVGSFIVYLLFNNFVDSLGGIEGDYPKIYNYLCYLQNINEKYNQLFFLGSGFVFCYFSSAPILVFHATRLRKKKNCKENFDFLILNIVVSLLALIIGLILISNLEIFLENQIITILSVLIVFSVFQITLLCLSKKNNLIDLNKNLTRNREKAILGRKTYVESYKHLREHGNAFFIVILEILLGLILYQIKTPEMMITCILVWILPGSLIWFFGNFLESDLT